MSSTEHRHQNIYHNVVTSATPNPLITDPDDIDHAFAESANSIMINAVELARELIGAHQSAIAVIVQGDWSSVRKFFSLSAKYAEWADYTTPAVGYGIHNWLLQQQHAVRYTQAELEAHPEWKNFGIEAGKHPPMRGWLAAPFIDQQGTNWGLFQLSDKYEGDFTEADEHNLVDLAALVTAALGSAWEVRNLRKAAAAR